MKTEELQSNGFTRLDGKTVSAIEPMTCDLHRLRIHIMSAPQVSAIWRLATGWDFETQ
jgi:hypothetical protein